MSVLIQKMKDNRPELSSTTVITYGTVSPKFSNIGYDEIVDDETFFDLVKGKLMREIQESPITVVGKKVDVNPSLLANNEWRDFKIKGKKYLVHKVDENVIEIYRVKN